MWAMRFEVRSQSHETAVDQNVWDARLFHAAKHFHGPLRRGHQQHVHAAGDQLLDSLLFKLGILFGRSGYQRVAGSLQRRRNTTNDFREKRMQKIRHHESEQTRAASDERPSRQVWAVIHFFAAFQDAGFCF